MADRGADDGGGADHGARDGIESGGEAEQQVGEVGGHAAGRLPERLDEERIAAAAFENHGDQGGFGFAAEQRGELAAHLVAGERMQVEHPHTGVAAQFGDQSAQRPGLARPIGADQQSVGVGEVGGQEGEQFAAGVVGPVQVFQGHDHRPGERGLLQHGENFAEQPHPVGVDGRAAGVNGQLRQPVRQRRSWREQRGDGLDTQLPHQGAQYGQERRERDPAGPQLRTASDQHQRVAAEPLGELPHQPGFADPGLPRDQHRMDARVAYRLEEYGHFGGPPDQGATSGKTHHSMIMPRPGRTADPTGK